MSEKVEKKNPLYVLFTGLCMGAADIVPGVSGGTMAFIMGIYDQLLDAIKSVDTEFGRLLLRFHWKQAFTKIPWKFVLPLGFGIGTSLVSLSKVLVYCLINHEQHLMAFFFGLIAASIVAMAARQEWSAACIGGAIAGTVFAYWLVGQVPASVGHSVPVLFGSGVLAISAMILPGISGAFILLILGQYTHCVSTLTRIIDHVRAAEWSLAVQEFVSTVLPIGCGAVIGLMLFSRVLSWLLKHYHNLTVSVLIGFMIGSLRRIWPYKNYTDFIVDRHGEQKPIRWENIFPDSFDGNVAVAIGLCLVGFALISALDHVQDRRNPIARLFYRSR
jgi:putative membrane protein